MTARCEREDTAGVRRGPGCATTLMSAASSSVVRGGAVWCGWWTSCPVAGSRGQVPTRSALGDGLLAPGKVRQTTGLSGRGPRLATRHAAAVVGLDAGEHLLRQLSEGLL